MIAGTDCGFATFAGPNNAVVPSVVWAKLAALAEGARLASERLWALIFADELHDASDSWPLAGWGAEAETVLKGVAPSARELYLRASGFCASLLLDGPAQGEMLY